MFSRIKISEMPLRLATGLCLLCVTLLALWGGGGTWRLFLGIALLGALFEMLLTLKLSMRLLIPVTIFGWGAIWLSGVSSTLTLLAMILGAGFVSFVLSRFSFWFAGLFCYMLIPLTFLSQLRDQEGGGVFLFLFLISIMGTDIFAMVIGKWLGGAKLCPHLSPGKTWAGAFGGLMGGVVCGYLGYYLLSKTTLLMPDTLRAFAPATLLLFFLALSCAAQLGDLLESWYKRSFGLKNSSSLLPGHGGIMDRLDSIIGAGWFLLCVYPLF